MNFTELQKILNSGYATGVDPSLKISSSNEACAVNGFVALQLTTVSPQYERGTEIEILFGKGKGTAFLITSKKSPFLYSQASHLWVAAYLAEQSIEALIIEADRGEEGSFEFSHDYLVIHTLLLSRYEQRYRNTSAIWGAFTHTTDQNNTLVNYQRNTPINAIADLHLPTQEHIKVALRSASQPSALDRYLNLYHLLELSFDYDLVEQIKGLDNDLKGIGKLLSSHSNSEFDRLKKLLLRYFLDITEIAEILDTVFSNIQHHSILWEMLFDYSKESNPYKEKRVEITAVATTGFNQIAFSTNKLDWKIDRLAHFMSYIVYRFRCSIAHASIGEFIIGNDEEDFVAEVAEPLIRSIIFSVFKKPGL